MSQVTGIVKAGHSEIQFAFVEGGRIFQMGSVSTADAPQSFNLHHTSVSDAASALTSALNGVSVSAVPRWAFILPGVRTEPDVTYARDVLREVGVGDADSAFVLDDTSAALLANHTSLAGICAFAGSGASVFCGKGLERPPSPAAYPWKLDGWGPILGDRGGGFTVGVSLLREICECYDATGDPHPVVGRLARHININSTSSSLLAFESPVGGLQNWFDSLLRSKSGVWRTELAKIALVVSEFRRDNPEDELTRQIVENSAREIGRTITKTIRYFNANGYTVVCQGGMFRDCPGYFDEVSRFVRETYSTCHLKHARLKPLVGGLRIALGTNWRPSRMDELEAALASLGENRSTLEYQFSTN